MFAYILRRLLLIVPTLFGIMLLNFVIVQAAPGGPVDTGEQPYNDDSGKTYGVMILTAMGISMVVPEFAPRDKWQYFSVFTIFAMVALYGLFLRMQVGTHSYFFSYAYPRAERKEGLPSKAPDESEPATLSIAVIIVSAYSIHTALRNLGVLK